MNKENEDVLRLEIDWALEKGVFQQRISIMVEECRRRGKVLPLPINFKEVSGLEILSAILSQVNCERCDAHCCRWNPGNAPTYIHSKDYVNLIRVLGIERVNNAVTPIGDHLHLKMPCAFLEGTKCSIYEHRPFVCIIYPLDIPATDAAGRQMMALCSSCPEARRIAGDIYMTYWEIRKKMVFLGQVK